MTSPKKTLKNITRGFASVIPAVDTTAEHERWKPGIGPFEEERQLEMILAAFSNDGPVPSHIEREVTYPDSGRRCDFVTDASDRELPVEAKLLRFRRDNGNIDPNMYKSIFSPFPERSSSSLLTDAEKLTQSAFDLPAGLLGLYYEKNDEVYEQLRAERIAEKFAFDAEYWFDIDIETVAIEKFDGLQHPHHQKGAVIGWLVK